LLHFLFPGEISVPTGVPPTTNLHAASSSADNDVHQQAEKDPFFSYAKSVPFN